MTLNKLTTKQEKLLDVYRERGIEIGLAVGGDIDETLVRQLTDAHRIRCGVPAAKQFVVFDSPFAAIKSIKGLTPGNALYGQHDINWLQFYEFFRVECKLTGLEKVELLRQLTEHVGWMWMCSDTTVITRRPEKIHMMTKPLAAGGTIKVLHNYNGLALEYRDGTGVYTVNGTRIPTEFKDMIIQYPDDISVERVMNIKNTEIRTEFLKKIGVARAFDKLNKQLLDKADMLIGGTYSLFTVDFGGVTRTYLQGECPSNQEAFYEAIPPNCTTVAQALSWRNTGKEKDTYQLPVRLT